MTTDTMSQHSKTISEYVPPEPMRNKEENGLGSLPFPNLLDTDYSKMGQSFYPDADYNPYTVQLPEGQENNHEAF